MSFRQPKPVQSLGTVTKSPFPNLRHFWKDPLLESAILGIMEYMILGDGVAYESFGSPGGQNRLFEPVTGGSYNTRAETAAGSLSKPVRRGIISSVTNPASSVCSNWWKEFRRGRASRVFARPGIGQRKKCGDYRSLHRCPRLQPGIQKGAGLTAPTTQSPGHNVWG